MQLDTLTVAELAWAALTLVWLAGSFRTKRAVRVQSVGSRVGHICLMVVAVLLIFNERTGVGVLGQRFIPDSEAVRLIGLALTMVGIALMLWARFFLGRDWSGMVTVKENHRLVRGGPYRIVRHPIYSGILLGLLGTAIVIGEVHCLLGLALTALGLRHKLSVEEQFMTERFGAEYGQYRGEVKALIPFIW